MNNLIKRRVTMDQALDRLRQGGAWAVFWCDTRKQWYALAAYLAARWPLPAAMDKDDLVQEMLSAVPESLRRFDATRGVLSRWVVWRSLSAAKLALHRCRAARCYYGSSPSRCPVPVSSLGSTEREISIDVLMWSKPEQEMVERVLDGFAESRPDERSALEALLSQGVMPTGAERRALRRLTKRIEEARWNG